jgi:NAD dependent epimerase/dehydratase family enzyme
MKKIVITAANGFLGEVLAHYFVQQYPTIEIITLTRKPFKMNLSQVKNVLRDGKTLNTWQHSLENADALINLAGKSVNCRYNEANKAAIFASRLESTAIL